jgi:tetrahydromethanopterin S-methyltransferase subunit C
MRISAVGVIYLVVGVVVAATHDYFEHFDTVRRVLNAILAVVLAADPVRVPPSRVAGAPGPVGIFEA